MQGSSFKPAWWLRNPHLQTLWPPLFRPKKPLPIKHERFELPDGDFVDLNWVGENQETVVLILHGFEGSADSPYANGMLHAIYQQGWRGVVMHFRGCSGEPNRLQRSYHSGETDDLTIVMQALCDREPNTRFAAIGFSLGGNVLLKWLGETGRSNPLFAAIAVSVPFELKKTSLRICQGFSRFYEWYLLKCVCNRLRTKFQNNPSPFDLKLFSEIQSMFDFDNRVTAPLHGFSDAEDYYTKSSCRQYLHGIRVPTLLLHAKDDPFMTEDVIPEAHELPEQVKLEVTDSGGHVGFVAGRYPWRPEYWLERRVPEFLREYLRDDS